MATLINTTNIPPPRVPIIDERTGAMSREWYRFFLSLFELGGGGSNPQNLNDLQKGPRGASVDEIDAVINKKIEDLSPSGNDTSALIAQALQALEQSPENSEVAAQIAKAIQALEQSPPRIEAEAQIAKAMQELAVAPLPRESNTVNTNYIDFELDAVKTNHIGRVGWGGDDQTLDIGMDFNVVQQVGQETYARVRNSTGSTIPNGTVVGFSGAASDALEVAPYLADGTSPSVYIVGVMTHDLPDSGGKGYCTNWGFVRGIDTSAFTAGDILYASPTVAGALTNTKPTAPDNVIVVAACVVSDASDGVIFVRPTITQQMYYGTFARITDFTPALADTAYAIPFDDTRISNGVVIGTPATRIVVPQSGFYDISATLQYVSTNASSKTVYSWIRANGVDVPESTRLVTVTGNNVYTPIIISETVSLAANEYIEIMTATSEAAITVVAEPATAFAPVAPAVNLVVDQVQQ